MMIRNNKRDFGWVTIALHWILAIALIAMYFVGDWMVGLDYYNPWYKDAPDYHRSVGVIIGVLMLIRLVWNASGTTPSHVGDDGAFMRMMAKSAHTILYLLVFVLVVSGYLITTAKGQGVEVFGLFEIPAFLSDDKDRGEFAGDIHRWMGLGFIILVGVHAFAALLHHFWHKDRTLKRMLGIKS